MTNNVLQEIRESLLPCPFCEGEAIVEEATRQSGRWYWAVNCIKCNCYGAKCSSEKEARTAWNKCAKLDAYIADNGKEVELECYADLMWRPSISGNYSKANIATESGLKLTRLIGTKLASIICKEHNRAIIVAQTNARGGNLSVRANTSHQQETLTKESNV